MSINALVLLELGLLLGATRVVDCQATVERNPQESCAGETHQLNVQLETKKTLDLLRPMIEMCAGNVETGVTQLHQHIQFSLNSTSTLVEKSLDKLETGVTQILQQTLQASTNGTQLGTKMKQQNDNVSQMQTELQNIRETLQLLTRQLQQVAENISVIATQGRTVKLNMCAASQQSTYTHTATGVAHAASFAIDGDISSLSCTTGGINLPWWSADIGQARHVTAVHIYADTNTNYANRYDNFRIWLSNTRPTVGQPYDCSRIACTLCYQHRGSFPLGGNARLNCEDSLANNRYVIIQSSILNNAICLYEVQVYGD